MSRSTIPLSAESLFGKQEEEVVEAIELLYSMNYPKATPLTQILSDVSSWSKYSFVMEPNLDRAIQIFAPRKMEEKNAFNLLLASLEATGLRAIEVNDQVIKIVEKTTGSISA